MYCSLLSRSVIRLKHRKDTIGIITDIITSQHHRHHVDDRSAIACTLTNDGRRICGPVAHSTRVAKSRRDANARRGPMCGSAGSQRARPSLVRGRRAVRMPIAAAVCGNTSDSPTRALTSPATGRGLFRQEPGPRVGLAAVRSGHVMYIEGQSGDGQWIIRDYNSGGGLSRIHVRSVRGYVFVNPNARVAGR